MDRAGARVSMLIGAMLLAPSIPLSAGETPRGPTMETTLFRGKVAAVVPMAAFSGKAILLDCARIDPRWVVTLEVVRVEQGRALHAGETVHFIVHSPSRDLLVDTPSDELRDYEYRVTRSAHGRVSRTLRPVKPALPDAPAD